MPRLYVALIRTDQALMANVMDPMGTFALVAAQAQSFLNAYIGAHMIIAPEYFLNHRMTGDATHAKAMTRARKHHYYDELKDISARLNDTIIVAGTIFYKKGIIWKKGLNVCPILQNGRIIHKYYKLMDDGNLAANDDTAEFASKDNGATFTASGVTFGIEVCGDSANPESLDRNFGGVRNSGTVDVYIVIADGAGIPRSRIQARAGGYSILTNMAGTGGGQTQVLSSAAGNWGAGGDAVARNHLIRSVPQAGGAVIETYRLDLN
jgi:predicted amidohydrolase